MSYLYSEINIIFTPNEDGNHIIGYKINGINNFYVINTLNITTAEVGLPKTFYKLLTLNTYCNEYKVDWFVVPECGYNRDVVPPTDPSAVFGESVFLEQEAPCENKVYNFKYIQSDPESFNFPIDVYNCKGAESNYPEEVTFRTGENMNACFSAEVATKLNSDPRFEVLVAEDNPCECSCFQIVKVYNTVDSTADGVAILSYIKYVPTFYSPTQSEFEQSKLFKVNVPFSEENAVTLVIIKGSLKLIQSYGNVIVDQIGDCTDTSLCGTSPLLTPIIIPDGSCGPFTPPWTIDMSFNEIAGYTYTYYTNQYYAVQVPGSTVVEPNSWSGVKTIAYAILINDTTGCEYRRPITAQFTSC